MRTRRAADHSPTSSAAVMEEYSYTSTHTLGHTGPVTGTLYLYLLPPISEVILDSIHGSRILSLELIFILTFQNWICCSMQPHSQMFTSQSTTCILYFPHSVYAPRSPSLDPNNIMHLCKNRFIHYVTFANIPLKFQIEISENKLHQ